MSKDSQEKNLVTRGRYDLTDPATGKRKLYTRVTKFSDALDDKEGLIGHTARHVVKGLVESDDLLVRAAGLELTDRGALDRIWNEAKRVAGGDRAADDGTTLHALTEAIDRGEDPFVPPKWRGHMNRYRDLVENGPLEVIPEYIERVVCVPEIGVAGTFDRLMRVKWDHTVAFPSGKEVELKAGEIVVVDVKSSKSLEFSQLKFSVQFACYSRAKHVWVVDDSEWEPLPEINQEVAFIYWIPSTKQDASVTAVDIDAGWDAAQMCQRVRAMRNSKKLISDVYVPVVVDTESYEYRIRNAETKEELSAIWKEANEARFWTPALEALGKNRLREIS